ncbi:MAG: serine hydrolase domain-containing protein [Verrucomicrobiia bacterium]
MKQFEIISPRFVGMAIAVCALFLTSAASSDEVKFNSEKLNQIPQRLQKFVDDRVISGAVALVADKNSILFSCSVGYSDIQTYRKMRKDDLFWIASMTKPITATAVMMLADEGKINIDDSVEKYLPEFKNQWMIQEKTNDKLTLVKPSRPITLRDLLTHTSGLNDLTPPRANCSLAELVMAYSQLPLKFPPGSRWEYSNSGINTLGRIVEVVSGKPYSEFLQERIFKPLGMKNTTFWLSKAQVSRVAKSYEPDTAAGGLKETTVYFIQGDLTDKSRTPFPAGGLFSTAEDICKFYQMVLNKGVYRGKRILSESAIDQMTKTQTGDLKTGFTDGMSFGLGFAVVKEPQGVTGMLSKGTFGHGGAYGTQSWADPQKGVIYILMIQRAKLPNADASDIRKAFQQAAAAAFE